MPLKNGSVCTSLPTVDQGSKRISKLGLGLKTLSVFELLEPDFIHVYLLSLKCIFVWVVN